MSIKQAAMIKKNPFFYVRIIKAGRQAVVFVCVPALWNII